MLQATDQVDHLLRAGGRIRVLERRLSSQRGVGVLQLLERMVPVAPMDDPAAID